jgi:GTP cyclohydrolase III
MYNLLSTYYGGDNIILHMSSDTMQDILAELTQKMNV